MPAIIEGYSYDIFISYRQKDNKYDGWVTEFVDNLNRELEATFKEEVSVYFDINLHDGLLETHDVNASLKDKLKCLIFIPIISHTYCDSKSFAWQHEFCAFNQIAKEDRFGRDIRLASGNVASRILPVKIHDLDPEDKDLLEKELGGVLRAIEFIYKSAGVNRPLRASEDHQQDNLNKTYYRDQINKVANGVKEIITALKRNNLNDYKVLGDPFKAEPLKQQKPKLKIIILSLFAVALFVFGYFFIQKILKPEEVIEKSIAVLPFENRSDDNEHLWFGDAMTDEITQQLYKIRKFIVRPRTSVMQYKGTAKSSSVIGKELNVNFLVAGSAQRYGDQVRINVQLINTVSDIQLWAETYEGNRKDIISIQTEIAKQIAEKLKTVLSPEEILQIDKKTTDNPEALDFYLLGNHYYQRGYTKENIEIAAQRYRSAIEKDQDFAMAYVRLSLCYSALHWFDYDRTVDRLGKSKEAIDKAFKIDSDLPQAHLALGFYYYWGFLNYKKALEEVTIAQQQLINNSECYYAKANIYRRAGEWQLAKENFVRATELDPASSLIAFNTAETFSLLCEYQEAEKYFNKAILLNPTLIESVWQKGFMYLKWKGNTLQARETIKEGFKYKECSSEPKLNEFDVMLDIYDGNYDKALANLSSKNYNVINYHLYFSTKSLLYAKIYGLLNMQGKAREYYDSARIVIEPKILSIPDDCSPEDAKMYSAAGIAYAGLGLKEKAIEAGKKAVELMSVSKEAYRGASRAEDLARIYVMVGEYDAAIKQIKILLDVPSRLSVKMLLLDPFWKPLWDKPAFKKIIANSSKSP